MYMYNDVIHVHVVTICVYIRTCIQLEDTTGTKKMAVIGELSHFLRVKTVFFIQLGHYNVRKGNS